MTTIDATTREHLQGLLEYQGMDKLDSVIEVAPDRVLDEVSLWSKLPHIAFLGDRPVMEQDHILVEFGLEHLGRILDHAAAAGTADYSALLSFAKWEWLHEGDPVSPRFLITHPSRGFFDQVRTTPALSAQARYVTELVGNSDSYEIRESLSEDGDVMRVYVRRRDQPKMPD